MQSREQGWTGAHGATRRKPEQQQVKRGENDSEPRPCVVGRGWIEKIVEGKKGETGIDDGQHYSRKVVPCRRACALIELHQPGSESEYEKKTGKKNCGAD